MTSGLSRSPPPARSGPRDEKAAVNGAGVVKTIVAWLILAVAPVVAAYVRTAVRSVTSRWTVGTKWKSAKMPFAATLVRIIPTPPASLTARLLSVLPFVPRSQITILPATFAGSRTAVPPFVPFEKHRLRAVASAPVTPAALESISGAGPTGAAMDAP
jgi:hypothetical protein